MGPERDEMTRDLNHHQHPNIRVAVLPGSISRQAGGLFTSVRRLSESVREQDGFEITVIGNRDRSTAADVGDWRVPPRLIDGGGMWAMAKDTGAVLNDWNPDVVHPQFIWSYGSLATTRFHGRTGVPYVISPRGMLDPWAVRHHRFRKRIAATWFETRHLNHAACLHALCASEADAIRAYGLTNPIVVIPNGIDLPTDDYPASAQETASRRQLLFLGRLHEKKGVHHLIDAWSRLCPGDGVDHTDGWELVIAGFGDAAYEQRLRGMIEDHRLGGRVRWVGAVMGDAKLRCLRSADAFILPSYSEGLPMSVLEAWAHRLPVLMTERCNLPVGFDAGAAIEIEPNEDSIASALQDFFRLGDQARVAIGVRGRSLVADQFEWSTIASQFADVYRDVASGQIGT